ncbi:glycosyltransferase family 2 protein [Vibrio cyclitrophicus]|uniref:glycosyltransferase family 2 protein n=1 Tax=Vibrio cyclitrophicus TaxID=47951 RepID=UPI000C81B1E3|nr:glycosyltransferase family 2 protein [Vibrio cyclitrophicus]PMH57595.1 hypothetical protein BCU65_11615 [Vibrio cyclitrophicus]
MTIFVSIVSHGHGELIKNLGTVVKLAQYIDVTVKLNKSEPELVDYLDSHGVRYIDCKYGVGFAENNNIVFDELLSKHDMKADDVFLVLNPDVITDFDSIDELVQEMGLWKCDFACINLFRDTEFTEVDPSIRRFPKLFDFISSFLGLGNSTVINKVEIFEPTEVDWSAGSFLAFRAKHYIALNGFDERYFMYCEDIDICFRSSILGKKLKYFPNIKAIHLAKHGNRNMLSKHFYWHLKSVVRYLVYTKRISR